MTTLESESDKWIEPRKVGAAMGQEDRDWYREKWKQREAEDARPVRTWMQQKWAELTTDTVASRNEEGPKLTAKHLLLFLAAMAVGLTALLFR